MVPEGASLVGVKVVEERVAFGNGALVDEGAAIVPVLARGHEHPVPVLDGE